ncbi:hypothetical protein [Olivibacter sitiensis]|uniref:hypothetical protein n=1 Tax=Olivibacter sitiensis TaxID=376470 RepID=UPI00041F36DE|nr:hypothetical protein [Olivibacter sitiensis]
MIETFTSVASVNSSFANDLPYNLVLNSIDEDEALFSEYIKCLMNSQLMDPEERSIDVILDYVKQVQ